MTNTLKQAVNNCCIRHQLAVVAEEFALSHMPVMGTGSFEIIHRNDKPDAPPHASKMPRKDSEEHRESRWGPPHQDSGSRGGGRGGRGGFRQGQDSSNNWNKPPQGPRYGFRYAATVFHYSSPSKKI